MRKVTRNAATAFWAGTPGNFGNTTVTLDDGEVVMLLHGREIARWVRSLGSPLAWLQLSDGGHPWSGTTQERINGLLTVSPCEVVNYTTCYRQRKRLYIDDGLDGYDTRAAWDGATISLPLHSATPLRDAVAASYHLTPA